MGTTNHASRVNDEKKVVFSFFLSNYSQFVMLYDFTPPVMMPRSQKKENKPDMLMKRNAPENTFDNLLKHL